MADIEYYILNERNQFIGDFTSYEDALDYLYKHEPPCELWTITTEL